ncbi:MAG: hypothetical protein K2H84_01300 [Paramuribaculum sp.]|nr:hypothetical protein [Paramuribaculum sp.]
METAIIFIMLAVCLSFALKLTFMKWLPCICECAVIAGTILLSTDFVTSQSKTGISTWISSPDIMLDVAVILTIDVALQIAFCISIAKRGSSLKDRICTGILKYIPGVLIFPVMAACLVELIFSIPGMSFYKISVSLAIAILICFPLMACGLKMLLPGKSMRLELTFYTNCIIAFLGIITTVNGRTAVAGVNEPHITALCAVSVMFILGAAVGILMFNRKNKILK